MSAYVFSLRKTGKMTGSITSTLLVGCFVSNLYPIRHSWTATPPSIFSKCWHQKQISTFIFRPIHIIYPPPLPYRYINTTSITTPPTLLHELPHNTLDAAVSAIFLHWTFMSISKHPHHLLIIISDIISILLEVRLNIIYFTILLTCIPS